MKTIGRYCEIEITARYAYLALADIRSGEARETRAGRTRDATKRNLDFTCKHVGSLDASRERTSPPKRRPRRMARASDKVNKNGAPHSRNRDGCNATLHAPRSRRSISSGDRKGIGSDARYRRRKTARTRVDSISRQSMINFRNRQDAHGRRRRRVRGRCLLCRGCLLRRGGR